MPDEPENKFLPIVIDLKDPDFFKVGDGKTSIIDPVSSEPFPGFRSWLIDLGHLFQAFNASIIDLQPAMRNAAEEITEIRSEDLDALLNDLQNFEEPPAPQLNQKAEARKRSREDLQRKRKDLWKRGGKR